MANSDAALRRLVIAIANGNSAKFSQLLAENPALAKTHFETTNATRQAAKENFVPEVGRYIYRGDTALHFAAAAYEAEVISRLISLGADVRARNRLGDEPLQAAAMGTPASERWNPKAQSAAIKALIKAGADPNTVNKMGVSPLHKAVRTRCADAVRTLLESGADPARRNKRGSNSMLLASMNTGRGGSGSAEAKAEQQQILELLKRANSR
ncbi:MAG TPA: ankyrin repeat domain-containing protein [Terracidiphilus sp.]|jgi:ankyrin repeat protein|nr:ankyrin repeat domain-containing protein [Terracidiphilus sp.]